MDPLRSKYLRLEFFFFKKKHTLILIALQHHSPTLKNKIKSVHLTANQGTPIYIYVNLKQVKHL